LQLERINNLEILEKIAKEEKGLQETYSKSENSIGEINLELNEKEKALSSIKDKVFSLREEHRKMKIW